MDINKLPTIELNTRAKNLTGKKQGKITFIKPAEKRNNRIYWWIQCECGNVEKIRADSLKTSCHKCSNETKSKKLKQILMNMIIKIMQVSLSQKSFIMAL